MQQKEGRRAYEKEGMMEVERWHKFELWRFADEFHYYETRNGVAPSYGDAPAKNWEATKALKHFTGMIEREMMKNPKTGDIG